MRRTARKLGLAAMTLGLAGLLPLGACGVGARAQDDCGVPNLIRVVSVASLPDGRQGQTDRCAPGGTLIEVLEGALDRVYGTRLVAHELAHAAGHAAHLSDPDCILYEVILQELPQPCPEELTYMQTVVGPLTVRAQVNAPHVVAMAVDFWNAALGRTLFILE